MPSQMPNVLVRSPALMAGADPASIAGAGLVIEARRAQSKWLLLGNTGELSASLAPIMRLPPAPLSSVRTAGVGLCLWLRPNQYLFLADDPMAILLPGELAQRLAGTGVYALDAGSRFQGIAIHGEHGIDLLNAGCSMDFRERAFPPMRCVQTRIEQVPVILHRDATTSFELLVERPLAAHLWLWLQEVAKEFTLEKS